MDRQPADGGLWLGAGAALSDPDRDACYGSIFIRRVRSLGIRDHPTSARSPWQNGYAERLIGSIRRECLDHIVMTREQHLRHIRIAL
jgi:transposase InsO family protein